MNALTPRQLLASPELALVDIRPLPERYGSVGFIPGSLSIPTGDDPQEHRRRVAEAVGSRTAVIVCLSGRRARHWVGDGPSSVPGGAAYLEGGVLAWSADGLPVCGRDLEPSHDAPGVSDFPRHMAACFVGQLVEVSLDQAAPVDPMALLEHCFARAGVRFDAPTPAGLLKVLDVAAIASLEMGTPIARVAENLDHMLARLPAPAWALVA